MWKIYLKGFAMGAADIVPGVSGGTIAFITGIYERLIHAIAQVSPGLFVVWRKQGFLAVWQKVDGTFLLLLFAGILTSVFSLARLISFLLAQYPSLIWGFFFGLIVGSIWFVAKAIRKKQLNHIIYLVFGIVAAYAITTMSPSVLQPSFPNLFICGAIAICAMVLPGVSGSFLLLLLGMYTPVLDAVKSLDVVALSVFASGCLVGLIAFTHLLNWLLARFHDLTMAVLTGFMIGALSKVWPWKYTTEYRIDQHGASIPVVQKNLWPDRYEAFTGEPSMLGGVLALAIAGAVMVIILEKIGTGSQK